ncbi:DUF2243 domain-containing protein [Pseudorhizobium sp. NPDC055634]
MSTTARPLDAPSTLSSTFHWSGHALGFALGGFFDGILLHQVLQWHHLLSGLQEAGKDIRFLIMTDGLFHVLMYVIAAVGLWLLWRSRGQFALRGADRSLLADALIGFGAWHVLDSLLSHWILGIHRIRMDAENPLFWDLLWLALFGVLPAAVGLMLRRRDTGFEKSRGFHSHTALVAAILIAGPLAALPAPDDGTAIVVFRPGVSPAEAMAGLAAANGRLLWSDAGGTVWAVDLSEGGDVSRFYAYGALLVSNSILPVGCLNWTET